MLQRAIILGFVLVGLLGAQQRRALIIGNAKYGPKPEQQLQSPGNDAVDMHRVLTALGYQAGARPLLDADLGRMIAAIRDFVNSIGEGDDVVVYYSGHGMELGGANYLLPIGFSADNEDLAAKQAIEMSAELLAKIQARTNGAIVVILDACRNNSYVVPFRFKATGGKGLAPVNTQGAYIAYATAPGSVAADGAGRNSLFTKHLLRLIERNDLSIYQVFNQVRSAVRGEARNQIPFSSDGLQGEYYFHPKPAVSRIELNAEDEFWSDCKANLSSACETYLKRYPAGKYRELAAARIPAVKKVREPEAGETRTGGVDRARQVHIPAGSFRMGCSEGDKDCDDDEKPAREVTISRGFWMHQTEVTVESYRRFVAATKGKMPDEPVFWGKNLNPGWSDSMKPIVNVSWEEAKAYCLWSGGRLPTEAEWEYAARGGTQQARYGELAAIAWYGDNAGDGPLDTAKLWKEDRDGYAKKLAENGIGMHAVGLKDPNALGLYDMLGNVWEWTADWYGEKYYSGRERKDPQGPPNGTRGSLRGGSWYANPSSVRASYRGTYGPVSRGTVIGFRCVGDQ